MSDAARPDGPIATGAAILDAPDEAGARAILARLLVPAGVEVVRSGSEPYDKLGAQSRIWFWWRLPAGDDPLAAVVALAEAATALADRGRISMRRDDDDPAAPSLAVVVASNVGAVAVPGLVWLDLDCDLAAEVQADLERALTS
ncbi:MAG: hypothetical protein GX458_11300 [Phyllobacteriaceae bacterium]|nr:hypothetical protein [Phyllobacteriaceae bacterium]